jgi:excisionase family DNA binding protein
VAKQAVPRDYVTFAEAAAYMGVCVRTARGMVYDKRLTAYRMGPRVVRLRLSDIDAAMSAQG